MSGRQAKILNEQAERYGLPFDGATVDLPAVVKSLHNFLAANAAKLAADEREKYDPGDELRKEKVAMARLNRLERQRELIPRDAVREALDRLAVVYRSAGETLQRQFGNDALQILNEGLEDAERVVLEFFEEEAAA
jgi:hypothetical protein